MSIFRPGRRWYQLGILILDAVAVFREMRAARRRGRRG